MNAKKLSRNQRYQENKDAEKLSRNSIMKKMRMLIN